MKDRYPIHDLLEKYIPVKYIPSMYQIPESKINEFIKSGKLRYAEMKDPDSNRRIPFVNIEELLKLVESESVSQSLLGYISITKETILLFSIGGGGPMNLSEDELIVAIDPQPSLNSAGVCIVDSKCKPVHYECIVPYPLTSIPRLQSNYLNYRRIFRTYKNIKYIAYESQISAMRYHRNAGNILPLAENIGILKLAIAEEFSHDNNLKIFAVPPGDIKSFATGNAKAEKSDMIAAVKKNHLKVIERDIPEYSVNDVVDAYHLARLIHKSLSEDNYEAYILQS